MLQPDHERAHRHYSLLNQYQYLQKQEAELRRWQSTREAELRHLQSTTIYYPPQDSDLSW